MVRGRTGQGGWRVPLGALILIGAIGAASAVASAGCQTVATLNFQERTFSAVRTLGLTPPSGSCAGSSGEALQRFVLLDENGAPIVNGDELTRGEVSLERGDLEYGDEVLYATPDVVCTAQDAPACPSGFACDASSFDRPGNVCQDGTVGVTISSDPRVIVEQDRNQYFGVLVEKSASTDGQLPERLAGLSLDYTGFDGSGPPDGSTDDTNSIQAYFDSNPARASDRTRLRGSLISRMGPQWEDLRRRAEGAQQVVTFGGVWVFGEGEDSVVSQLEEGVETDFGGRWGSSEAVVSQAFDLGSSAQGGLSGTSTDAASVYTAIRTVLEQNYAGIDEQAEKVLVVIVDGPDDFRADAQLVASRAEELGVRLFILHFDPSVSAFGDDGANAVPLLPDLPDYINAQADQCASDEECKNFEECALPWRYARDPGVPVTQPTAAAADEDATFCRVARDIEGRVGPIEDYAEIACRTNGSYLYLPSTRRLDYYAFLPQILDGLWEAEIRIDAFADTSTQSGEAYKLGSTFSVSLDDAALASRMDGSVEFEPGTTSEESSRNTAPRPVLFAD